jgi:SPP1 family predicted phage head-tail adaptor
MQSFRLRERITILEKQIKRNNFGEDDESFEPIKTVSAEARQPSGNERFTAQEYVAHVNAIFIIRPVATVTPLNRIHYRGRMYNVLAVLEIRQNGRITGYSINAEARAE